MVVERVQIRGVGRPRVMGYEGGRVGLQEGLGRVLAVAGSRILDPYPDVPSAERSHFVVFQPIFMSHTLKVA